MYVLYASLHCLRFVRPAALPHFGNLLKRVTIYPVDVLDIAFMWGGIGQETRAGSLVEREWRGREDRDVLGHAVR